MQRNIFKCSFCDSSETRVLMRNNYNWESVSKVVSQYFTGFTYDHFLQLCDSCLTYSEEFFKSRKLWLKNEGKIHKKRMMGQFNGLKDIVRLKNRSFLICRLCFGGSPLEEVIFIYHENNMYQPGYIQNILNLHANNIDLNLTENPVICRGCLDGIQTFDALYQMCLQNQASKSQPDFKRRSSSDFRGNEIVESDTEKYVPVYPKKNKNNSLVSNSVTEIESAVNNLIRNKEISGSPVILNGWPTKNVIEMVQNPKSSIVTKSKLHSSCVVSDEADLKFNVEITEFIEPDDENTLKKHNSKTNISNNKNGETSSGTYFRPLMNKPENKDSDISSLVIEIEDSDEEEEEIVIPSILNIATVNETDEVMEIQDQTDSGVQDVEAYLATEMSAVDSLFDKNNTNCVVDYILNEYDEETITGDSEVEDSSDSNISHVLKSHSKVRLEENLSDFLEFNKNTSYKSLKRPIEPGNQNEKRKKARSESTFDNARLKTYSTAYEQFLNDESSVWKLLRGSLPNVPNPDEYCSWFPFYSHTKKYFPSTKRKYYMTALENRLGSRIYRCNVCLYIMNEEESARSHSCPDDRGRRRLICSILNCNFYTYNDFLFSKHNKAHAIIPIEVMQRFKCNYCEFFSVDKNCIKKHREVFHAKEAGEIIISKCNFCFFESPDPDILAHHISVRHSNKKTKFTKQKFT